jgi:dihydroorotase
MKILIKNGRIINPASHQDDIDDLYIANGKIIAKPETEFNPDQIIDATGLWVIPGLVDLSARLREPGQEHTATIATETAAAAAGGITTLCIPPDTDPVIDNPAVVELIEDRAKKARQAMVLTYGAMTQQLGSDLLAEMARLKAVGCVGISNGLKPIKSTLILQRAMAYAATLDLTVFLNAADPWLQTRGCVHEGTVSARLGLGGIPESAETIAVSRDLILIEQTGVSAHFHNLSSAKAVKMIAEAQNRGLPVTADVSAHHLHLCEHDTGNYDAMSHVLPPFRTIRDREQLQQAVRDGVISAITSHHQPLDKDAKLGPFAETQPGISGLETLLPLTLKLVEDDELALHQALAALTIGPANILGINAGQIKVGADADLCLVDPNCDYECQPLDFVSAGKNSPFGGWLFTHQVSHTLFHGRLVYHR